MTTAATAEAWAAPVAGNRQVRARHVYTALADEAPIGISLPAEQPRQGLSPGRVTLDAAAALYQAERWLPALEDWLGCGIVPQLTRITDPRAEALTFSEHVTLSHPEMDVQVHLPMPLLSRQRAAPPAPFQAQWNWQPVRCELVLDSLPLTPADLQAIEVGALVLLPASFAETWEARLQPTAAPAHVFAARLSERRGRLCANATGDTSSVPPTDHATARFRRPVAVRPHELFGWLGQGQEPAALEDSSLLAAGAVMVHGSAQLTQARPLVMGQLIPVGSGFALRLDGLPAAA
jgi:hypothetical protein